MTVKGERMAGGKGMAAQGLKNGGRPAEIDFLPKKQNAPDSEESKRRLLISPPPSAAQRQSNSGPLPGKWPPSAIYGTNVVAEKNSAGSA